MKNKNKLFAAKLDVKSAELFIVICKLIFKEIWFFVTVNYFVAVDFLFENFMELLEASSLNSRK